MFNRAFPRALRSTETILARTNPRPPHTPVVKLSPLARPTWHPQSTRHSSTAAAAKKLFKENPFSVSLASVIILLGAGGLVYVNYIYQTYIIGDFKAYPEEIAVKLRRALYYTNIDLQPQNALKYYRQALALSEEMGLDPFSDEILGVKLQVAALMEKVHSPLKAIEVLSLIHDDCLRWLEQLGNKPGNEGKRTRVLEKCVRMSVRLGDLCSSDAVGDTEAAEGHLVWAVTALLKELKRREVEGVKEGEGPWMNNEETGAALESLGTHYLNKEQYYLAAPLFLQAITLIPHTTCHSVILMNNLSTCLAQQPPPPNTPLASTATLLANARTWAKRALAVAATIKSAEGEGEEGREECDQGCAVAMVNLGQIARMAAVGGGGGGLEEGKWSGDGDGDGGGNEGEARRWFEDAKRLSRKIGFKDGVRRADEGLKSLEVKGG